MRSNFEHGTSVIIGKQNIQIVPADLKGKFIADKTRIDRQ